MSQRRRAKQRHSWLLTLIYSVALLVVGGALVERLLEQRRPAVGSAVRVASVVQVPVAAPSETQLAAPSHAMAIPEPLPEPAPEPELTLMARAKVAGVYSKPDSSSRRIGYLRTGAVVRRAAEPEGFTGCKGGWYRIVPEGFVCVGRSASLEVDAVLHAATSRRPERARALPYHYGRSRNPPPQFYTRVPSVAEQRQSEPDIAHHLKYQKDDAWRQLGLLPTPGFLQNGQPSLRHDGTRQSALVLSEGQAVVKSGFGLLALFESDARAFGLTTDLAVVPLDRLDLVQPSSFHGLPLSGALTLPVVFNRSRHAWLYDGDPAAGLHAARQLDDREALAITGRRERQSGKWYLQTTSGQWLADQRLTRVDARADLPHWARESRPWIDVSLRDQTLVAYEGATPVFVTLVSTGIDGVGDPDTTHSTIQGEFLIHTKHVSATMDGDEVGDEYDLRDVPYVQYFHEGYALHGVYWHDGFGAPRSHGCVNLSPHDARWLFGWTTPTVPVEWHGAMSLLGGTLVAIHP